MFKYLFCLFTGLLILKGPQAQTAGPAKSATDLYDEGIRLEGQKEYSRALESFKKAIAARSTYKEALFEAGWCSNELGQYNDAISYLTKARDMGFKEPKVYFELGYASQKLGKNTDARTNYDRCIELKKDYKLAYKYRGNLSFTQGSYEAALEDYAVYESYESNITSDDFYYKKGYCLNESGKYNDAIEALNRSAELKSDEPSTYDELGYAYYKIENPDGAIKNYNKSVDLKPSSNVPYLGLGDVYKEIKKNTDEALKNYLKAVSLKPESKKGQYCVGWCYNDKGQYNDAIPYLQKAISLDGQYFNALTELGYSYYALQKYYDALAQFKKVMNIKKTILAYYYSGLCYVELKTKSEALKMYDELRALSNSYADKLKQRIDNM